MTSALLGSVDTSRAGIASGTLNTARQTGSVIGVALFGSLAASGLVAGLRLGLIISIALALAVVVLSTRIDGGADVMGDAQGAGPDERSQPLLDSSP